MLGEHELGVQAGGGAGDVAGGLGAESWGRRAGPAQPVIGVQGGHAVEDLAGELVAGRRRRPTVPSWQADGIGHEGLAGACDGSFFPSAGCPAARPGFDCGQRSLSWTGSLGLPQKIVVADSMPAWAGALWTVAVTP